RLLGLTAKSPFVGAKDAGVSPLSERQQPRAKRVAVERLHGVEERKQQHRREVGQDDDQRREHDAAREPPCRGPRAHRRVDELRRAGAEEEPDAERLRLVGDPGAKRLVRQVVAAFEQKSAVEDEWKACGFVEQRQKDDEDEDDEDILKRRRRIAGPCPGDVAQRRTPAGQEQAAEDEHRPDERDDARLTFQTVISGGPVLVHLSRSVASATVLRGRMRTPPFVVCSSIGAPPPFSFASKCLRDFSATSRFWNSPTLMPPLVTDAELSAFPDSGSVRVTAPLVVCSVTGSRPTDERSMLTPPLVVRASMAPVSVSPFTWPLVVCAVTLPLSPVSETWPLVLVTLTVAPFGALT